MKHTATMLLGMTLGVILTLSAAPKKSGDSFERRERDAVKSCIGTSSSEATTTNAAPVKIRF